MVYVINVRFSEGMSIGQDMKPQLRHARYCVSCP
jgi:hypothetical protein